MTEVLPTISRIVVVDENGRIYDRHNLKVEISTQDHGKTLKLFVKEAE